ncbi:VOC family protein [Paraburkholderia sp. JHI869]|uniref:VOC family protein n=1 Tax=Paraburkholderia sp. JHI869 TaxID=3112959 RepID=UPI0031742DF8
MVAFIKTVFQAHGEFRHGLPAEIRIGDSVVMVSGSDGLREPMPAFLYVYVADTDSTYQRAIAAQAVSLEIPADLPYGDRRAMVRDPWGNTWQIATHQRDLSAAEIRSRLTGEG